MEGPLKGITVVDLSRVLAGPYCTMVLADLGARVIKVENPDGGDDARRFGPFINGKSAYFMSLNRGKESIALDLKDEAGREIFEELLGRADVLVENFRPRTMEKLGYGWDALHKKYPRLIYAATSGFGHSGPYSSRPAYDMVVQAMGGLMSLTGHEGGPPTRVGSSVGDITAGLFTAIGVNSALFHRQSTAKGMMVDVAMLDGQVAILENAIARYAATGTAPAPTGSRHPSIAPFDAYRASDGYFIIAAGNNSLFRNLADALERQDMADNPLFADNEKRCQHQAALKAEIEEALSAHTVSHWLALLEQMGIPSGPINDVSQVMEDVQVAARNMIVTAADGTGGRLKMAGNPVKLSAFGDASTREAAPDLDESREKILAELDKTPAID